MVATESPLDAEKLGTGDERSGEVAAVAPSFVAVITKPTEEMPLGLQLDLADGRTLYIGSVRASGPTPALAYNAIAHDEQQLRPGDYIIGVNGARGEALAMAERLKSNTRLELEVQRPSLFTRQVDRAPDERLGLELTYSDTGSALVVTGLSPGGASERSAPDLARGDRIVAVGGDRGTALQLLEAMKSCGLLTLTVSRCHGAPDG